LLCDNKKYVTHIHWELIHSNSGQVEDEFYMQGPIQILTPFEEPTQIDIPTIRDESAASMEISNCTNFT